MADTPTTLKGILIVTLDAIDQDHQHATVRAQLVNATTRAVLGEWRQERMAVGEHIDITTLSLVWEVTA